MADNQIPFATDDIAGVFHPRVKVEHGPDGEATDVSQASPLPTQVVIRTDALFNASVSCLPIHILISASSSSNITLITAQASARMRVLSYVLNAKATTSVTFNSSTTPLTGVFEFDKYGGAAPAFNPVGHFQTGTGQPLIIATGAGAVAGHLVYIPVSV